MTTPANIVKTEYFSCIYQVSDTQHFFFQLYVAGCHHFLAGCEWVWVFATFFGCVWVGVIEPIFLVANKIDYKET